VQCGTRYCYKVVALLTRANTTSNSNEVCETATSNQNPVPGYLSSTFTPANTIQLNFVTTEKAQEITYQKKTGSTPFANLTVSDQLSIIDQAAPGQPPLCYQATFRNICNQVSAASNTTCPIFLEVNSPRNGIAALNWSAYEGFPAGVAAYYIQTLDANGMVLQTDPVSGTTLNSEVTVSGNQQVFFRIRATPNNNQAPTETFSNTVIFRQEFKLIIPNAFSPNGDGLNEVFEVKGQFLANYRLLIYDRWGQILFDNQNQSRGWDGRLNGKEIPTGAYPYRITGKDASGKEFTKTGTVTLLR
jgi:gliding motility-associated-like protein